MNDIQKRFVEICITKYCLNTECEDCTFYNGDGQECVYDHMKQSKGYVEALERNCKITCGDRDRYAKFLMSIEYMRLKDGTTVCKLDDGHYSVNRNITAGFANELVEEVEGL